MSSKSLFISTLSLMLGIGAVTHAKTQLIEKGVLEAAETEELAHRFPLPSRDEFQPTFYESCSFGDAPNYWFWSEC